eukprot:SAG22_NODE_4143_length_1368_cov_2.204886_2_plen_64_part_01
MLSGYAKAIVAVSVAWLKKTGQKMIDDAVKKLETFAESGDFGALGNGGDGGAAAAAPSQDLSLA